MHAVMPECDTHPKAQVPSSRREGRGHHHRRAAWPHRQSRSAGWHAAKPKSPPPRSALPVFYDELGAGNGLFQVPTARRRPYSTRSATICLSRTTLSGPEHRRIVVTYRCSAGNRRRSGRLLFRGRVRTDQSHRPPPARGFWNSARSCVLKEYRSKRTIEALWQGIGPISTLRDRRDDWLPPRSTAPCRRACRSVDLSRPSLPDEFGLGCAGGGGPTAPWT